MARNTRTNPDTAQVVVLDATGFAGERPNLDRMLSAVDQLADGPVVCEAHMRYRIAKQDRPRWDKLISSGRIVTPPAGACGGMSGFLAAATRKACGRGSDVVVVTAPGADRVVEGARNVTASRCDNRWVLTPA